MNEMETEPRAQDMVRELAAVLGRRVDELERENGRLRRSAFVMMGLGALLLLITSGMLASMHRNEARVAEVVEAKRFVLRDGEGHVRAVIGVNPDNSSRFVLQDRDGHERLRMSLLADGSPGMAFSDRTGKARAVLGVLADETSTLVFADRSGRTRAVLGLSSDEASTLVFADRYGEMRVGVGVESDGSAGVTLFEKDTAQPAEPAPPEVGAEEMSGTEAAAAGPAARPVSNLVRPANPKQGG
jgi:hypothetical protein